MIIVGVMGAITMGGYMANDSRYTYTPPFTDHELFNLVLFALAVMVAAAGVLTVVFAVVKRRNEDRLNRVVNTTPGGMRADVCSKCGLNLSSHVQICPRCGTPRCWPVQAPTPQQGPNPQQVSYPQQVPNPHQMPNPQQMPYPQQGTSPQQTPCPQQSRRASRTVVTIPYHCTLDEAQQKANVFLTGSGFKQTTIPTGELVWKKGTGMMTAMQFLKLDYAPNEITLSAWIQAGVGSLTGGEMPLTGVVGALPKRQLLGVIERLKALFV